MSKILIADLANGAARLRKILSAGHELTYAENTADVLSRGEKESFDLVIVGVLFDQSRMFEVISAAKHSPLAGTPLIGFSEDHTKLSMASRDAMEGLVHVLGAADYIDTRNMSDSEILERIESAIAEGKSIGASKKANDTPGNKRMRQNSLRWTKTLTESSPQKPYPILLISTECQLAAEIEKTVKEISGVCVEVSCKPVLTDGLVAMANDHFDFLICDLHSLQTSDARNALRFFARQLPAVVLSNSQDGSDTIDTADETDSRSMLQIVSRTDFEGLNLALTILSSIYKVESIKKGGDSKFSDFLLEQIQLGLKSIDTKKDIKAVLHDFAANLEKYGSREGLHNFLATVLLQDRDEKFLRSGAAPSMPEAYCKALESISIGPESGSCGTAAFLRRPVYVTNIDTDPKWAPYLALTQQHGLKACWSIPLVDDQNNLLATFAIYYRAPREPMESELRLIGAAAQALKAILIYARRANLPEILKSASSKSLD